ncbi:MAG: DUF177 domain-containing protein [Odoribacteraceae bacterium]|nr:DUF177 domain-containing protein [Odoribacteraceae bacterium]
MDKLKEYKVAHKGLKEGTHSFRFTLDRDFFNCFEATGGTEGEVTVEVEVMKHSTFIEIRARLEGKVKATCDRCLDEMELPLSGEMTFFLKQGGREEGNDDDFIVLPPGEDHVDLSVPLYELFMLSYPARVTHPDGECDPEMERLIEALDPGDAAASDPRWDELNKLINN